MKKTAVASLFVTLLIITIVCASFFTAEACHPPPDKKPPKIRQVLQYPTDPEYEDSVFVLAYITDSKSGVANATVKCMINGEERLEIGMNKSGDLYYAEIPPQPYNSTVTYVVYACDKAGNKANSAEYAYTVNDFHPPIITYIKQIPNQPNYNETVSVIANAEEPTFASGIKELTLDYNNGTEWTQVKMSYNGTFYTTTIPTHPYGTNIQYTVHAFDNAGNTATLDIYSYTVTDHFPPVIAILNPNNGSVLARAIEVTVQVQDFNLLNAKLMMDETVLAKWNMTGTFTCPLDTRLFEGGSHVLTLEAVDEAENFAKQIITVTVDNTMPTARILKPLNNAYLSGIVLFEVQAEDANFQQIEFRIGDLFHVWKVENYVYAWNTTEYNDGVYEAVLTAVDKAGNKAEDKVRVTVDNTAPIIVNVSWTPLKPTTNETVKVSAQIAENGSGIKTVTLWFRQLGSEWQNTLMTLENGNWTAVIPEYMENATITFYVKCSDYSGNIAYSTENYYIVEKTESEPGTAGFFGIPLYWLLLIIIAIFAVSASTAYVLWKRRRGRGTTTYLAITSL